MLCWYLPAKSQMYLWKSAWDSTVGEFANLHFTILDSMLSNDHVRIFSQERILICNTKVTMVVVGFGFAVIPPRRHPKMGCHNASCRALVISWPSSQHFTRLLLASYFSMNIFRLTDSFGLKLGGGNKRMRNGSTNNLDGNSDATLPDVEMENNDEPSCTSTGVCVLIPAHQTLLSMSEQILRCLIDGGRRDWIHRPLWRT